MTGLTKYDPHPPVRDQASVYTELVEWYIHFYLFICFFAAAALKLSNCPFDEQKCVFPVDDKLSRNTTLINFSRIIVSLDPICVNFQCHLLNPMKYFLQTAEME